MLCDRNSVACAMASPFDRPSNIVRIVSRFRVPYRSSNHCFTSLLDILVEDSLLPVECQGEQKIDRASDFSFVEIYAVFRLRAVSFSFFIPVVPCRPSYFGDSNSWVFLADIFFCPEQDRGV